jgi:hypothetical protein
MTAYIAFLLHHNWMVFRPDCLVSVTTRMQFVAVHVLSKFLLNSAVPDATEPDVLGALANCLAVLHNDRAKR